jgi:hypothetical protein
MPAIPDIAAKGDAWRREHDDLAGRATCGSRLQASDDRAAGLGAQQQFVIDPTAVCAHVTCRLRVIATQLEIFDGRDDPRPLVHLGQRPTLAHQPGQ